MVVTPRKRQMAGYLQMRFLLCAATIAGLSACGLTIPNSGAEPDAGAGVGFQNYAEYEAQKKEREAQLTATHAIPPSNAISDEVPAPTDIGAETLAALNESAGTSTDVTIDASPANPEPVTVSGETGISGENDFAAVDAQRSIEGDKELIARNRERYKVVATEALPTRTGSDEPNIVAYALNTRHSLGTQVYSRIGLGTNARHQRNCAKYPSPDRAQAEFLSKGGPNRDRLGLDPDGDGFACSWDPGPFRKALGR